MMLDPKVQRIMEWRESFATLPDTHFFELIRMYLGEIKTPYNKQNLIEELSAFLRKKENKDNILALLTEKDIEIITAVKYISNSTLEKLSVFFEGTYSYADLYENILNLEERLILYRHADSDKMSILLSINPLLEEVLEPVTGIQILLPKNIYVQKFESIPFGINPQFISSFISFVYSHYDMYKADGSFKKRTYTELKQLYGTTDDNDSITKTLELLSTALWNLNIIQEDTESSCRIDKTRLENFAELPDYMQYIYLCAAGCGHFGRSTLRQFAQFLLNIIMCIPHEGLTKKSLLRLAYFIKSENVISEYSRRSSFQSISSLREDSLNDSGIMEYLIDSAITCGLLYTTGINDSDEKIYCVSPLFKTEPEEEIANPKVLSIDAGFSITIMPGLSLLQMIKLISFMDCIRYDTAAVFEITKSSCMRSFDSGYTPQKIFTLLQQFSAYELSQNLCITVEEWYSSYSSASLYKGYVLKVNDSNCILTEKNPVLAPYIKLKLADGIYLLDIYNDDEAKEILHKSGLDFVGNIKTPENKAEVLKLPVLESDVSEKIQSLCTQSEQAAFSTDEESAQKIISELKQELNSLDMADEQKEGLSDRIDRRIVINAEQLRPTSVRFEKLEATGMDFSGKLHVIDSSIESDSMIEFNTNINHHTVVGKPIAILNKKTNAVLRFQTEPEHEEIEIPVSQIQYIKKLRGSVLK